MVLLTSKSKTTLASYNQLSVSILTGLQRPTVLRFPTRDHVRRQRETCGFFVGLELRRCLISRHHLLLGTQL
jgi:hypothetical protein